LFVSSSSGKIFGIGGNSYGVNTSIMGFEGGSNLEIGVPNFESSIPTDRGKIWVKSSFALSF